MDEAVQAVAMSTSRNKSRTSHITTGCAEESRETDLLTMSDNERKPNSDSIGQVVHEGKRHLPFRERPFKPSKTISCSKDAFYTEMSCHSNSHN